MSEKSAPQPQLFRDIPGLTEAMIGVTPPVAPLPPPVERERPFGDWSISWEKFQQNLGEFGPAVKENFINIVKSGGSKRWARDFWTVFEAGLLEVPVIGPIASLGSMLGRIGLLLGNEVRKVKSLGKEEYLNRSALKQAGEAMFKTTFKREGKETAVGKRGRSGGQTEDLVLTNTETAIAGAFGFGSSLAAIAILEDISLINFIPGMKAAKRLYLAPLLTMLISSGFGALGESYFDVFKRSDKVKDEKLFQQKKAQFVEMVLAVNAPVMQIMMTMGIATSLAEKAGEYVAAHPKAEVMSTPQPELTPTPVSPLEHIVPPVTTGTQPLEATPIPSAEMPVWHPGETVDNSLLQKAFGSGVNYDEIPINIDNDPESETVYRFNLDSDPLPEVWAVKDNQGVWQPWIWEDKGGLYKADLNLDGQIDQGSLSLKDLEDNNLLYSWQGGGGERGPLNLELKDYDLDDDGNDDLLNDANGWYLDRNKDFTFGEGDVRLSEEPVFYQGQVIKLEADDGQMWWRGTDGKMMGLVRYEGAIVYHFDREANPLQPDFDDNIVVEGYDGAEFSLEAVQGDKFQLNIKNAEILFGDGGRWEYDSNGLGKGYLADDRTLALDSAGETGIWAIQHALATAHPDWSPDEVGKAAFLAPADTTRSSILNIHLPEPYQAPSGTLSFDQLAMGPRGGDEGIIMHDVHEVNMNLNATQVAQAAHIAVVNNNLTGPAMIGDVNTSIARFSLENVFGQIMAEHQINSNYISGYAQQAALTAIRDNSIGWQIPNDKINGGQLNQELLQNFTSHNYGWWEDWLKSHGYIN